MAAASRKQQRPTGPVQVTPPRIALTKNALDDGSYAVVALPVLPAVSEGGSPLLGPGSEELNDRFDLLAVLDLEQATGRAGEVTSFVVTSAKPDGPTRILLVGVGEQRGQDFRRAGAALARAVRDVDSVGTTIPAVEPDVALAPFVEGLVLGSFLYHLRSAGPAWKPAASVTLALLPHALKPALSRAVTVAEASWLARTLATVPASIKNPQWLAEQAEALAKASGLKVAVWDEKQLAAEGFGGIVAVGKGSATPPRLIRLDHTPSAADESTPTVVLVGKGITFDTGGLDIKPPEGMLTMKRDMTGGGVVIAVMQALAALDCPVKVVGLVPAAENAVSGSAMRPGDVITHFGGRTSEVNNTDAEGRLVLADALAYAVQEIEPDVVVDIATLTGAVKVSLGQSLAGVYATDEHIAAELIAAGAVAGEPLWRLPLSDLYEPLLSSKVADGDNAAGGPGSITAALFLQHFVGKTPWVHLDIASVGDARKDEFEWTAGPTGFGARLLLTWLGGSRFVEQGR